MARNGQARDEDGIVRDAETGNPLLSQHDPVPSSVPSGSRTEGWDPIPFYLLAYFFAAGFYFVTFNLDDMPDLPWPLIGNLLADTPYVQIPNPHRGVNTAFVLLTLWGIHFLKRFIEVMWVHNYTHTISTVEAVGVILYYSFFGVWLGWSNNIFLEYFPPVSGIYTPGILIFIVAEILNFFSHAQLKRLRSKDICTLARDVPKSSTEAPPTGHVIPNGCLFSRVSCPHYLFEMITWLGFAIASFTLASFVFFFASSVVLCVRARQKHNAYKHRFGNEYPAKRKAVIPFIF